MNASAPPHWNTQPHHPIVDRAAAILRAEIAEGALSNIAAAERVWATHRPALLGTEITRHFRTEIEPLLELLAPPSVRPAAPDQPPLRASVTPSLSLRPTGAALRGSDVQVETRLRNDGSREVELGLICSDLIGSDGLRIPSEQMRVHPSQLRLLPGASQDLTIDVHIPTDTRPGLYRAIVHAGNSCGPRALLSFHVQ